MGFYELNQKPNLNVTKKNREIFFAKGLLFRCFLCLQRKYVRSCSKINLRFLPINSFGSISRRELSLSENCRVNVCILRVKLKRLTDFLQEFEFT